MDHLFWLGFMLIMLRDDHRNDSMFQEWLKPVCERCGAVFCHINCHVFNEDILSVIRCLISLIRFSRNRYRCMKNGKIKIVESQCWS